MKQIIYITMIILGGCSTSAEPDFDKIMADTEFSINFDATQTLALEAGMNPDEAIKRMRDQGFDEKRLIFRARPSPTRFLEQLQKSQSNPPPMPTKDDCLGLDFTYGHKYYRNETEGSDLGFSIIELWQGSMLIDGHCKFAVTSVKPVKTYKIKNIISR